MKTRRMPLPLSCLPRIMMVTRGPTLVMVLVVDLVPGWLTLSRLRTTRCRRPDLLMMLNLMTFRAFILVVVKHTSVGDLRLLVLI